MGIRGATVLALMVMTAPALRAAGGDWIEALPGTWNVPGATIPTAPAGDAETLARCVEEVRPASTAADRALEAAGWKLFGPVLSHGSTSIVRAMSNVDGMCRPLGYHAFVFVGDDFAGTLTPAPMDSRTDGSLSDLAWLDATSASAVFSRYGADAPLCCPTRQSMVGYTIESRSGAPVVIAQTAETTALAPPPEPPAPPPPIWTGDLGAGVSLTTGNTETSSFNLSFTAVRDPKKKYVFRTEGLYLRSEEDSVDTNDKTTFLARGERSLSDRFFAFAEAGYLRDRFKDIEYLLSPMVGLGWKAILPEPVSLVLDAGVGGAFEKFPDGESSSSGAFKLGEALDWAISKRATLTQGVTGLWKMDDTEDAYYHADIGVTSSLTDRSELKVSYLVDYDNLPTTPDLEKTDSTLLVTVVMKF